MTVMPMDVAYWNCRFQFQCLSCRYVVGAAASSDSLQVALPVTFTSLVIFSPSGQR